MTGLRTVYIESTTAWVLKVEAARSKRSLADVYREYLKVPDESLCVRVVNLDEKLMELLAQGMPWAEVVRLAFEAAP